MSDILDILWNTLPARLPGKLEKLRPSYANGVTPGYIRVLVPIKYPNGDKMDTIYCRNVHDVPLDSYVIFSRGDAKPLEREKHKQPNLMQATEVRVAAQDEIDAAIKDFDRKREEQRHNLLQMRERELDQGLASLSATVEELFQRAKEPLIEKEQQLAKQQKALSDKELNFDELVKLRVEETLDPLLEDLAKREDVIADRERTLDEKDASLDEKLSRIGSEKQELASAREQFQKEGGPRFIEFLDSTVMDADAALQLERAADEPCPANLIEQLQQAMAAHSYHVDKTVLIQFVLSVCTAASTGQFVILSGPTGVGKTSLVNMVATALGCGYGVVPVRPAWIDPSDLLGFFNPAQHQFQPTPFMDHLLTAQNYATELNRPYLLTLDEMNLSRVENYAADFLSRLEKARAGEQDVRLYLYSREVEQTLHAEIHELCTASSLSEKDRARLNTLIRQRSRYPASLRLPDGLVMLGTVNMDETTHVFSPKFIDRSFFVQILNAHLPDAWSKNIPSTNLQQSVWDLSLGNAIALARQSPGEESTDFPVRELDAAWSELRKWQVNYLAQLGVRLGFRFPRSFRSYMTAAFNLGLRDVSYVVSTFCLATLLPRIRFHENEDAVGAAGSKREFLESWARDAALSNYPILKESIQRMIDRSGITVEYLE